MRRLRRLALWMLGALLLALLFHRPLIRFAAIRIAASQHVRLNFELSGALWNHLTLRNLRAEPDGTGPTPIELIRAESLELHFSLPRLLREGPSQFLLSYEVHHAELALGPMPPRTGKAQRPRRTVGEQIHLILAQPAAYADWVLVEDFTLRTRSRKGDVFEIRKADLFLAPDRPGYVRMEEMAIPHVPPWRQLQAATSYAARNLIIEDLRLAPDIRVRKASFDASHHAQHEGSISIDADFFGGSVQLSTAGKRTDKPGKTLSFSYDTTTRLQARNVNARAAAAYFGLEKFPLEKLVAVDADFAGEPELPRTWKGHARVQGEGLGPGAMGLESVLAEAGVEAGKAAFNAMGTIAKNRLLMEGSALLPESVLDMPATSAEASLSVEAADMKAIGLRFTPADPWSGSLAGRGSIVLRDRSVSGALDLDVHEMVAGAFAAGTGKARVSVKKAFAGRGLEGFSSEAHLALAGLKWRGFSTDRALLDGRTEGTQVELKQLELARGANRLSLQGTCSDMAGLGKPTQAPMEARFSIDAPDLAAFGFVPNGQALGGKIQGEGSYQLRDGKPSGALQINAANLSLGNFAAPQFTAQVKFEQNAAVLEQAALTLPGEAPIRASGRFGFDGPHRYEAALGAELKSLAKLQPLLAAFGPDVPLEGGLSLAWSGKGQLEKPAHEGELKLELAKARYGSIALSAARLAGTYGPGFAKTTELHLASASTALHGELDYSEGKLRLQKLSLMQGQQEALTGFLILPMQLEGRAPGTPPFRMEERLAANLNANNLDLERLFASFGIAAPLNGSVTASLLCGGTLLNPTGQFKLSARALKAKAFPQLDNAELDFSLFYADKALDLAATARQRELQPLSLRAKGPLDLEKAIREKSYDPALPLQASLKLPATSLAFLPKVLPAVRRVDGTGSLELQLGGTYGKPDLRMSADIDLKSARMAAENIPPIGACRVRLAYGAGVLNLQEFKGELGGGAFKLAGTVALPELAQLSFGPVLQLPAKFDPLFDLRLLSDKVLVLRNDSITVRADSDVKLSGPLAGASLTGSIYVVQSRFFKEIDILPIGLPGQPKPAPKSAPTSRTLSFANPPLRDWKFDVAIKTRESDPFGIRGNMANGSAALALRFTGTGLKPWLDGNIRIEKFSASLPFSTLNVTRGFVYFKEENPFQAMLDLQAESQVRDYLVNAYIFGSASSPQIQLSSEPPLPHSDLVSLLATGTTAAEFGSNPEALASRAAVLAIRELYQRVFRKPAPAQGAASRNDANLLDRFQLELGATDARTGQQQVISRFKINDQLYLVGDAGVDGQFTGRLKYLIRFH